MALQISGAAQLKVYFALGTQLGINVMGAVVTGAVTFDQSLADALGTAIKNSWTTNLATHVASNVALVRVGIRDIRSPNLREFRDTAAQALGTGTTDALPSQIALMLTLRTAQSGKSFRGRTYLPGFVEGDNISGGVQSATAATAAIAYVQSIDTTLKAHGMALGVLSYPSEEKIITETTNHANGTTTVRTLSHTRAKSGGVSQVTTIESRNNLWETVRRRGNGRGVPPALAVAEVTL